jgi:hypothetical protein
MNTQEKAKHTPFHHHPADGGFRQNCKRCWLDAAAPELYRACKAMLPIFDAFTQDELSLTTIDEAIALLPAARAAISKAEKGAQ